MKKQLLIGLCMFLLLCSVVFAFDDIVYHRWELNNNFTDEIGNEDLYGRPTSTFMTLFPSYGVSGSGSTHSLSTGGSGSIQANTSTLDSLNEGSVAFWMNHSAIIGDGDVLFNFGTDSNNRLQIASSSNTWKSYAKVSGGTQCDGVVTVAIESDAQWHSYILEMNATTWAFYEDNVLLDLGACAYSFGDVDGATSQFTLGNYLDSYSSIGAFDGDYDSVTVYNRTLTITEKANFHNYGSITAPASPPAPVSVIDLLFKNKTNDFKVLFNEGENLFGVINWTNSSGSPLSNNSGSCNLTYVEGVEEVEGLNKDINFCTNALCDFSTLTESFVFTADNSSQIVNEDLLIFKDVCKVGGSKDLEVDVACGVNVGSFDILSGEMPVCPSTIMVTRNLSDLCFGELVINVTVSTAEVPFSSRKVYHEVEIDREYALHTEVGGVSLFYNFTSFLWVPSHSTEYYRHGVKTVYANCSHFLNASMNNSVSETITIVNAAPDVVFSGVTTRLGFTAASDYFVVPYAFGVWNWSGQVFDDDLDHFNVSIFNKTGGLVINWTGLVNSTILQTPDQLFVEFGRGNPFSINVSAVDSENASTIVGALFNVSDVVNPSCNFSSIFVEVGEFEFDVLCTDENFFSLNVTCPLNPDQNFSVSGLNVESYVFNETFNFSVADVCVTRICDGHTKNKISLNAVRPDDSSVLILDKYGLVVGVVSVMNNSELEFELEDDRIKFNVNFDNDDDRVIWYQASEDSVYLPDAEFLGWVVDPKSSTWFDLNNDLDVPIITEDLGNGSFKFTLLTTEDRIDFYSVGELNCVESSFVVGIQASHVLNFGSCPTDLPGVFTLYLVFIIALFFMSVGWIIKNREAGFLGSFLLTFLSLNIVICHRWAGWICCLAGMYFMLWFVFKK